MQDNIKWITKNGVHIPITNDYMNKMIRNNANVSTQKENEEIIEATHIAKAENIEKIKQEGFDLSKAGTGAGSTFGKGVYFTDKENEINFYKHRLSSESEIKASINTKDFLVIEYDDYTTRKNGSKNAWDIASKFLTKDEQKQYKENIKLLKEGNFIAETNGDAKNYSFDIKQDALLPILEKNYHGVIVKQNTPALDIITGGNQIVVYDTSRIKIK